MPDFERWGLKGNPYTTAPIDKENLDLFVGRESDLKVASSVIEEQGVLVVEGNRGVGTTSFGNYLRFTKELQGHILTPLRELSVGTGWNEELLLANVLSSITWELEEKIPSKYKAKYEEIKSISRQIRATYRDVSLQLSAMGVAGVGVNKRTVVTVPQLIPTATLIQHLLDIKNLSDASGYHKGTIIQLNNLDVGTLFDPAQLASFLNGIRDLLQIEGYTWILVGDTGLRRFIADKVDRLDDIIAYDCYLEPLRLEEVKLAIRTRIRKLSANNNSVQPLSDDLIEVLYQATEGRIRQIFGFATRLIHSVTDNLFIEQITPEIAIPIIKREVEDRLRQHNVTKREREVLAAIAARPGVSPSVLSKKTGLSPPNISRILAHLLESRCVSINQEGRLRKYSAAPDVQIAFSKN